MPLPVYASDAMLYRIRRTGPLLFGAWDLGSGGSRAARGQGPSPQVAPVARQLLARHKGRRVPAREPLPVPQPRLLVRLVEAQQPARAYVSRVCA